MLRLIRPWASKLTPRASRQGPYLPDRDPILNLPIALTQCHFMWCLEIFDFLQKKKKEGKKKKSPVSLSEEKNLNHYDHFNAHTNGSNSLDMFGDRRVRIWFGLQPCWGFIPWPLQSVSLLCGERLRGGQVKPVSPIWCHRRFASRMEAGGLVVGGGGWEVVVENLSHLVAHRHSRTTTAYCLCKIPLSPAAGVDLLSRLSDSHSSPGISFMNLSHFNKVYYTILSLLWNKHRL